MSLELKRLHAIAEVCLALAGRTTDSASRDALLDMADRALAEALPLDGESGDGVPVAGPGVREDVAT